MKLTRGQALAYALGGLVGLLTLLAVWFTATTPSVSVAIASNEAPAPDAAAAPTEGPTWRMPPVESYSASSARPLFSENREPLKIDRSKTPGTPGADGAAAAPQVPLNVTLGGVILAPNLRLAMVTDNSTGKVVSLKEGMPMPGDLGGWTLKEIERAKVTFNGGESFGDTVVELKPPGAGGAMATPMMPGMAAPAPMQVSQPPNQPPGVFMPPGMADAEAQSRAEEIRRKVEQRRQELREEAARLATEKKQ
jgi:general secretion pathway protein N